MNAVTVVGAGLAGSEAAYQLAIRGIPVRLIEMKPKKMTPAHVSPYFAELVCSNSLRSDELTNAVGLLKEELRRLGSIVMRCADEHRVAAGGALGLYISHGSIGDFQPMNINFGIISPLTYRVKGKRNKNAEISARSLAQIDELVKGDLWNAYSH